MNPVFVPGVFYIVYNRLNYVDRVLYLAYLSNA